MHQPTIYVFVLVSAFKRYMSLILKICWL